MEMDWIGKTNGKDIKGMDRKCKTENKDKSTTVSINLIQVHFPCHRIPSKLRIRQF